MAAMGTVEVAVMAEVRGVADGGINKTHFVEADKSRVEVIFFFSSYPIGLHERDSWICFFLCITICFLSLDKMMVTH